ncbi:EH signature domain-containing protein [Endozoicomonas lisbonensis]|uniref:Zorya protein ZorC EH domain-containing protein n=1 Tax=Endozoicomonas lisbonensis TaxID=3120522 RepID=A0ABV2SNR1_9GAMM
MGKLSFSSFGQALPLEMQLLARKLDQVQPKVNFDDLILPVLPARDIDELLQAISEDKAQEISLLEWIGLFDGKEEWDRSNKSKQQKSNILIWKHICKLPAARRQAMWRLCQYLAGRTELLPKGMVNTFDTCITIIERVESQRTRIIQAIRKRKGLGVAMLALETGCKPAQLFARVGFPPEAAKRLNSLDYLEQAYKETGYNQNSSAYITIFKKLSVQEQDESVARLLKAGDNDKLGNIDRLLELLKNRYSPEIQGSRWSFLDTQAKSSLRELLGYAWFTEFRRLVYLLASAKVSRVTNLDERSCNQLKKRVTFWENYQSRLRSFRVFFPDRTAYLASNQGISLSNYGAVDGFPSISQETEVCVLEFEKYIIIEFLRGHISELRVFEKSSGNVNKLLSSSRLSLHQILDLECKHEHDHMIFWQNSCADMLKNKCSIIPDDHLCKFKIDDGFFIPYSKKGGLRPLTQEQINDRESQLRKNTQRSRSKSLKKVEDINLQPEDKLYFKEDSNAYAFVDSVSPTEIVVRVSNGTKFNVPKDRISDLFLGFS